MQKCSSNVFMEKANKGRSERCSTSVVKSRKVTEEVRGGKKKLCSFQYKIRK